ncbi:protein phosphatase 1A [Caerostris extrusa]|uniref:Protein phosphatase 1A n=1 Tax=Caerostris extrusa TaxID=172846 RepID=A0AAV4THB2_CAEEX|nr:protein phosphatase 1A [Caerostris extrusa]
MQGRRSSMEDEYCAMVELLHIWKKWSFFAIFDGHGGNHVSAYCSKHLLPAIIDLEIFEDSCTESSNSLPHFDVERIKLGIKEDGIGPLEQPVSPEPDIDIFIRDDEFDEFIILISNGVYNISSRNICNFVRYMLQVTDDLIYISNCIINACLTKGSKDNMSVLIVILPGAPKVSKEIAENDREINFEIQKT